MHSVFTITLFNYITLYMQFTDQESKISSIIDSVVGSVNELRFDVCTSCQQLTTDEIVQPTFDCDSRFPSSGI